MKRYTVRRIRQSAYGTYGRLYDERGDELCVTIERPWVDLDDDGKRDHNVSRFVAGTYRCFLRRSHLHGGDGKRDYDVWQFEGVPDVVAAQIHIANLPGELEGCIGLGSAFGDVERNGVPWPGVTGSTNAFAKFMTDSVLASESHQRIEVAVVDAFSTPALELAG